MKLEVSQKLVFEWLVFFPQLHLLFKNLETSTYYFPFSLFSTIQWFKNIHLIQNVFAFYTDIVTKEEIGYFV